MRKRSQRFPKHFIQIYLNVRKKCHKFFQIINTAVNKKKNATSCKLIWIDIK